MIVSLERACWLATVLCLLPCGAAAVLAQSDPLAPQAPPVAARPAISSREIETLEIIGRRPNEGAGSAPSPIQVIPSEQIELSGANDVAELLRRLPAMGFQGLSLNNNNGGLGRLHVDLRDLGSDRTLVLVNGRRFVSEDGVVDLGNIPLAMLERVEVLRDGAAATYGADAVAGVVNFVLKRDYSGTHFGLLTGRTEQRDGEDLSGYASLGRSLLDSRLHLGVYASYADRKPIPQNRRAYSRTLIEDVQYEKTPRFDLLDGRQDGLLTSWGTPTGPAGQTRTDDGRFSVIFLPDGESAFQRYRFYNPKHRYNTAQEQMLTGGVRRWSGRVSADYSIREDLSAFGELSYVRRESRQEVAPQPLFSGTTLYPAGLGFTLFNPLTANERNNPFLPEGFAEAAFRSQSGEIDPAAGPLHLDFDRRINEAGNRIFAGRSQTAQLVGGLQGRFLSQRFSWQAYVNFGRMHTDNTIENSIDLERALHTLDREQCEAHRGSGCVLGDYFGAGRLQPEVVDYIRFRDESEFEMTQRQLLFSFGGNALELPAGSLSIGAGAEYRREDAADRPSPQVRAGSTSGNQSSGSSGSFSERGVFWRASLPLVKNWLLAESLDLDLGGRWTEFSSFGSSYVYRYGVRYQPVSGVQLRSYYSSSFRAPRVYELFSTRREAFRPARDPCANLSQNSPENLIHNCSSELGSRVDALPRTDQPIRSNLGGNSRIEPEESRHFVAGMALTPAWLPGTYISLDYYRLQLYDPITAPGAQSVLNDCYGSADPARNPACRRITRDPTGQLSQLELNLVNLGRIETRGLDLGMGIHFDSPLGPLTLDGSAVYVLGYDVTSASGITADASGQYADTGGSRPKLKGLLRASWTPSLLRSRVTLGATLQFIGEARNQGRRSEPFNHVPSMTYVNTSLRYRFDSGVMWTLGVENLTDRKPPFVPGTDTNTQTSTYDLAGRRFFTRLELELD